MISDLLYLLCLVLAAASLRPGLWLVKRWGQRMKDRALKTYKLRFPRGMDDKTATRLIAVLSGVYGLLQPLREAFGRNTIVFELLSDPDPNDGLHWLLSFPPHLFKTVESLLGGILPDISLEEAAVKLDYQWQYVAELKRNSFMSDASASGQKQRPVDPKMVASLLRSTRNLNPNEAVLIQFVMTPTGRLREDNHPEFYAIGRLATAAGYKDKKLRRVRAAQLMDTTLAAYRALHVVQIRLLKPDKNRCVNERHAPVSLNGPWPGGSYIPEELAVMCGLPIGNPEVPGLVLGNRKLAPDAAIPSRGIVLGKANYPGRQRPLALSPFDLTKHMHIIGRHGTGKSTAIENQILQLIELGFGLIFIDPNGDSFNNLLDRISLKHADRLIVIDLTDDSAQVGFNPLASKYPFLASNEVLSVLHRLFGDIFQMAQTAEVLRMTLLTLAHKRYTLLDIRPALDATDSSKRFRAKLTKGLTDQALIDWWDWYERQPDKKKAELAAPVFRRLNPFEAWPSLKGSLGQRRSGFDFDNVIASGKILLVNLCKGLVGEEPSKLYGSLFVSQFWAAAQRRASLLHEQRKPYFLYIDEFQDYVNLPVGFTSVLDQARKYRLGFVVANHRLSQLPHDIREAVESNTSNKLYFRVKPSDAAVLAREHATLKPEDFQMNDREAVAQLLIDGKATSPVTLGTLEPRQPLGSVPGEWAAKVSQASKARYCRPFEDVDYELRRRWERQAQSRLDDVQPGVEPEGATDDSLEVSGDE